MSLQPFAASNFCYDTTEQAKHMNPVAESVLVSVTYSFPRGCRTLAAGLLCSSGSQLAAREVCSTVFSVASTFFSELLSGPHRRDVFNDLKKAPCQF